MKIASSDLDLINDLFAGCVARVERVDERIAAEREVIVSQRAIAELLQVYKPPRAEWDESEHPRHPPGDDKGGEFAPKEGGGGGGSGGEGEGAVPIDPRVANVGGDEWNKQTALRLEKEYQKAKPDLEAILEKGIGESVDPGFIEDDESSGAPTTWDELSSDQQEEAENDYVSNNYSEAEQSEYESWSEGDHPEIGEAIAKDSDWLPEQMKEAFDDGEFDYEDVELKLDADELANAVMLNDDGTLEWNDKYLATLSSYDKSGNQPEFPGFTPPTDEDLAMQVLPQDIRDDISKAIKERFEKEVQNRIENTSASDVVDKDYIEEYLKDSFGQMDDENKFSYAEKVLDLEDNTGAMAQAAKAQSQVKIPAKWEAIHSDETGYATTRAVATYMSQNRALELIKERVAAGTIATGSASKDYTYDMGDVQRLDSSIWHSWKNSSSSIGGKALQLAAAQELGGRVQYEPSEISSIIADANREFAYVGGYEGVKAYTRAKWETSQFLLDKADMPTVPTYRGIIVEASSLANIKTETEVQKFEYGSGSGHTKLVDFPLERNGAQSATANKSIANGWNGVGVKEIKEPVRVVIRVDAPRTAILSLPVYGQNIHSEEEIVLTGTAWNKWDAYKQMAPDVSVAPIMKLIRIIRAATEKKGGLVGPGPGLRKNAKGEWVFGISQYEEDLKLPNWLNEYRDGTHRSKKPPVSKPLPEPKKKKKKS